jgi:AcrR family transcriptional regulator
MARTRAADYDERLQAIVEEAARLFARDGFNGTAVSDIAKACSMSKSLLYHYYPSKEDLLYAVMSAHVETLVADVETIGPDERLPADELRRVLGLFMQHYIGASDQQKVLLNELENLPPERRSEIVAKQRRIVDSVQKVLVEARPELDKDEGMARARTMLLFGMLNWTMTWYDPEGAVDPARLVDAMAEMALGTSAP